MKFRIKRGIHTQDGRVYEAGDIVDSDFDLIKAFNSAKFERVQRPVEVEDEDEEAIDYGLDVTEDFRGATEMNVFVFHKARKYTVLNGDTNEPLHTKPIARKVDVIALIQGLR